MGLPPVPDREAYVAVKRDEAALTPGVAALCDRLGLGGAAVRRFFHAIAHTGETDRDNPYVENTRMELSP